MKTRSRLIVYGLCMFALAACSKPTSSIQSSPSVDEEEKVDEFGIPEASFDELVDEDTFDATKKATDRILVKPKKPGLNIELLGRYGVSASEQLFGSDWYTCQLRGGSSLVGSVKALRDSGLFAAVDYDYYLNDSAVGSYEELSQNPYFSEQDYLDRINAGPAWDYLEEEGIGRGGSSDVVVAVIDTGVDYNHEDLRENMWINTGEIPDNQIDDDGNGYIDDYYGVNVIANNGYEDSPYTGNCMDDMGHGTHVAGIIAAADNNVGVVGIANNVKIMAVKAGNSSGYFLNSDIVEAVNYAAKMGAQVINMSFGGSAISTPVREALENAYGTCTLVAAAGNDGMPNEYYPSSLPNYPGAYPFVLGVMAENNYGVEAPFTNYDVIEDSKIEYEVYAPGVSIISTLPNNKYARWSGTSMATPVVSGMAALLRSAYPDRDIFPVKALMAQIISCSHFEVYPNPAFNYHQLHGGLPNGLDMLAALTETPAPDVRYYNFYTFDSENFDPANNGNDVVDAGETIRLGIEMKNKGGVAKNVKLSISTMREGGVEDFYVKPIVSETTFPKIGTYSIQDGGFIRDDENNVVDVKNYVSLKINDHTPNDYICDIYLNWSWENGLDENDKTVYHNSRPARMQILVSRGTVLPDVISTDMTLTNDHLWIVNHNVIVNKGVVLTIEPGATIQWYTKETDKYNTGFENVRIIVNGTLIASGSEGQPIRFQPSEYYEDFMTRIELHVPTTFEYCEFTNFRCLESYGTYSNCHFTATCETPILGWMNTYYVYDFIDFYGTFDGCVFHNIAFRFMGGSMRDCILSKMSYWYEPEFSSLVGNMFFTTYPDFPIYNCLYHKLRISASTSYYYDEDGQGYTKSSIDLRENVFLYDTAVDTNMEQKLWWISTSNWNQDAAGTTVYLENNYFDNMPSKLMNEIIKDYADDGISPILDYTTYSDLPDFSHMYPFVLDAGFYDENGQYCETIGAGKYHFIAHFSRDMDTSIELSVGFGSVEPYNDFKINGAYTSKNTWEGDYELKSAYESGQNKFRIYNGRADTDHKKELMIDTRLSFHIDTSAAQSMNLHAEANENGVILTWDQDDYDTIAGYNLYRSNELTGYYEKINQTLIPFDTTLYFDTNVQPGETYYYNFTVVLSDFTESAPSGRTTVTTFDTMAPNVYHNPVATGYIGRSLVVSASVSDNVGTEYVRLYYRATGETEYQMVEMNNFNSSFSATIAGAYVTANGIEYYIDAFDGTNHTFRGSASNPYTVVCINAATANELGDVDGNGTITVYDALLCLKGKTGQVNLTAEQFERADVDRDGVLTSSDALRIIQFANGSIMDF